MKKIILLGILSIFILSGCGKMNAEKAIKEFKDAVESSKAYEIKGTMEIANDEDLFTYKLNVAFKKDDNYKVTLTNQTNNHEQIILKNTEGVYVITPSLNKSFKFQSDWPKNSSQAYLMQSLIDDLERNIEDVELIETDDGYILTADVNYPNNPDLVEEKIYFDKDMELKMVEVFNESGVTRIKVVFDSINYKAGFDDKMFELSSIVDENANTETEGEKTECKNEDGTTNTECEEKKKTCKNEDGTTNAECENKKSAEKDNTTSKLEDILYPLYVPTNTYLTGKDTIDIAGGERVILTFAGEKNFILVEETATIPSELEIIPVYGDPLMLNDTIAALSGNSLHWSVGKVNYYITGDNLSGSELMTIAESLANTTAVGK